MSSHKSTCRGRNLKRALIMARNGAWAGSTSLPTWDSCSGLRRWSMIDSTEFCSWEPALLQLSRLLLAAWAGGFCVGSQKVLIPAEVGAGVLWVPLSSPRAEVTQQVPRRVSEQPERFSLGLLPKVAKKSPQRQEGKFSQVPARNFGADSCFVPSPELPLYRNKLQTILTSLLPLNNTTGS